jgi:hypothetical protein
VKYSTGEIVRLGDLVTVPVPKGTALMRVVMIGGTYEHLAVDSSFLRWVREERKLCDDEIVLEWIDKNPFVHNDPKYAPVGNYMFSGLDEYLVFQGRDDG